MKSALSVVSAKACGAEAPATSTAPSRVFFIDFNMIASIGAFGFGLMQVYFFVFVVWPAMRHRGEKATQKPWEGAEGLECEVPSPAPFHTFENPPKLDATATRVIG